MDTGIFKTMVTAAVSAKKKVKISFVGGGSNKGEVSQKGEDFYFLHKKLSPTEVLAVQQLN